MGRNKETYFIIFQGILRFFLLTFSFNVCEKTADQKGLAVDVSDTTHIVLVIHYADGP